MHFDGNRYCDLMAGASTRSGTELLLFGLPAPLKLPAADAEYPPRDEVSSPKPAARPNSGSMPASPTGGTCRCWWRPARSTRSRWPTATSAAMERSTTRPMESPATASATPRIAEMPSGRRTSIFACWNAVCGFRPRPAADRARHSIPSARTAFTSTSTGEFGYAEWWNNLRAGQRLRDQRAADEAFGRRRTCRATSSRASREQKLELEIGLTFSTRDPITYLEIIKNGKVEHEVRFDDYAKSGRLPKLTLRQKRLVPDPRRDRRADEPIALP